MSEREHFKKVKKKRKSEKERDRKRFRERETYERKKKRLELDPERDPKGNVRKKMGPTHKTLPSLWRIIKLLRGYNVSQRSSIAFCHVGQSAYFKGVWKDVVVLLPAEEAA